MRRDIISDSYREVLYNTEGIRESQIPTYVRELTRRHKAGWAIPVSTYRRCRELLYYKESLGRHSPYYVDILKIEDRNDLKFVLADLCSTMRIRNSIYD